MFNELEFAQLKQEFKGGAKPGDAAAAANKSGGAASYRPITKVEDLRQLVKTFYDREQFAFALSETESGKLGDAAFSTSSGSADYFDFENCDDPKEAVNLLKDAFGNGLIEKSTHDLKRATRLLNGLDVELENVTDDTMLQAYLLDSDRTKYELPQLASEHLDHSITTGEESTIAQYADATGRLADVLNARILEDKIQYDFQQAGLRLPENRDAAHPAALRNGRGRVPRLDRRAGKAFSRDGEELMGSRRRFTRWPGANSTSARRSSSARFSRS